MFKFTSQSIYILPFCAIDAQCWLAGIYFGSLYATISFLGLCTNTCIVMIANAKETAMLDANTLNTVWHNVSRDRHQDPPTFSTVPIVIMMYVNEITFILTVCHWMCGILTGYRNLFLMYDFYQLSLKTDLNKTWDRPEPEVRQNQARIGCYSD